MNKIKNAPSYPLNNNQNAHEQIQSSPSAKKKGKTYKSPWL